MRMLALIGALGAVATLGACEEYLGPGPTPAAAYATPTAATAPGCFYTRDIRNHTIVDAHTALIDVNGRAVYRIVTSNSCFAGATSSDPLVMHNPPGQNEICRPIDVDLAVAIGGGAPSRCIVSAVTPLSPEEVAALPKKLRP